MADIDVSSPGDSDVVSSFPADERASRVALLALLAGTAFGGGDMGGSANAHTLTISNTGLTLTNGLTCWGIATATNTSTCTLQINSLTAKSLWLPNGTAISSSHPGAITSGRQYVFQYHLADDAFYVLNASGYMDQSLYDQLYQVGSTQFLRVAAAPTVPYGVTATWTLEAADLYLRTTTGSPVSGGSLTTSAEGSHTHTYSGTTSTSSGSSGTEGTGSISNAPHNHTFSGTTSAGSSHTHSIEPTYVAGRLYRRTA